MPTTKAKKSKKPKNTKKSASEAARSRPSAQKQNKAKAAAKTSKAKKSVQAEASSNGKASGRPPARRSTQDARPPQDKRHLVQERKILRSQARWLQKALFALSKAEDDQAKLAEVRGSAHKPMSVTVDGSTHELGDVTDSLRNTVMERLEGLRVTLRNEHSLLG